MYNILNRFPFYTSEMLITSTQPNNMVIYESHENEYFFYDLFGIQRNNISA